MVVVWLACAGVAITRTAEVVLEKTSYDSSRTSRHKGTPQEVTTWVPVLPAARQVLLAVMVHTQGVTKAAELLLEEHSRAAQQIMTAASAAGRSKGGGATTAAAVAAVAAGSPAILSLPAINSFLAASLAVAGATDATAGKSVAAEALETANVLFGYPLLAGAGTVEGTAHTAQQLRPDAEGYASMVGLCAVAGQYQQVADIVLGVVRKQLPCADVNSYGQQQLRVASASWAHHMQDSSRISMRSSSEGSSSSGSAVTRDGSRSAWTSEELQVVLAAAAKAWRAAGCSEVAVAMLEALAVAGVGELTRPGFAMVMLELAEQDEKVRGRVAHARSTP